MPRVKGGTVTRQRRKKVLKLAKGYRGSKHTQFKVAKQQVMKSYQYAFRDRRKNKSNFQVVDCSYQRCSSYERHQLQPIDARLEAG